MSAYNKVVDFIYEFYIHQPLRKSMFSAEYKIIMETLIQSMSKDFIEELEEYVEINYKQVFQ